MAFTIDDYRRVYEISTSKAKPKRTPTVRKVLKKALFGSNIVSSGTYTAPREMPMWYEAPGAMEYFRGAPQEIRPAAPYVPEPPRPGINPAAGVVNDLAAQRQQDLVRRQEHFMEVARRRLADMNDVEF